MFQTFGYSKDFYFNGKYIGSMKCDKDREVMGYNGRIKETITDRTVLQNKKVLKAGSEVITELHILSGNLLKPIS